MNVATFFGTIENSLSSLTASDYIQLGITIVTFLAVLVALFGERFWKWWDRPKVELSFNKSSDRCYRWAIVDVNNIQDEGKHKNVRRQYFRLKVKNKGGLAKRLKVKVEAFDRNNKELSRFEPSSLSWISGEETIDLARGETEYINFLSQVIHSPTKITNRLTIELFNTKPRGIAWDRLLDTYNFRLTVYGENIKAKSYVVKFVPNKDAGKPGSLRNFKSDA